MITVNILVYVTPDFFLYTPNLIYIRISMYVFLHIHVRLLLYTVFYNTQHKA